MQSSPTCSIPATAQAYSLNITVVPPGPLSYITVWPTGQSQPVVSTLNDPTGTIVANAAIVPAGTAGSINVFATQTTDLVIDINGYYAAPTDLNGNTAIGAGTLANNITGLGNTAMGIQALFGNTTGDGNTAIGDQALVDNTTGGRNTAIGSATLINNTTGNNNTAIGTGTLQSNTTGDSNTAIGIGALQWNTTGVGNTAMGTEALFANNLGNNNIAIGFNAAVNLSGTSSNNIHIGSQGSSADNATIRIGGKTSLGDPGVQTSFFVAGVRGVTTANNDAVSVVIDSAGQLGTVSSSRRFKEDIHEMGDSSSGLMRLRPVTFRYQKPFADGSKPIQYGLIAEEVAEVYPDLVVHSADGQIETVKYQVLDSMLLNEAQRQERKIHTLEQQLAQEQQRNVALEDRQSRLEAAMASMANGAGVQ
jgi:hypothetical protein